MTEPIVQLAQVFVFGVPEDDAIGLLGYVPQFNGTDEWLHRLEHPVSAGRVRALILPLWRITPGVLSYWAFGFYIAASVWIETWHILEHGVIIAHVIANHGCPCPGIGDVALGLSATVLHFFYNAIAYARLVYACVLVLRSRRAEPKLPV